MQPVFNIAPRVVVYPYGSPPPAVVEGWIALAQFDSWPPAALSSASTAGSGVASQSTLGAPQPAGAGRKPGCLAVTPQRHAVFGDGSHPTTRLCAGAVDSLCRQRERIAVLDVGTGTGILARIARARGASFVVGTDIDPTAVACAKAHAELDGVDSHHGSGVATGPAGASGTTGREADIRERATATGSRAPVADIHFGSEPPDHWGARFHLVVANILEAPLHALAPALCRALRPGGVLLISGFTRPQAPALRLAYDTAGLQAAGDFTLDDWVLLKFELST